MTKEQAIKIINESKEIYLNKDQKQLAKSIINSANEKDDIQGYLDFIMKRTGLGFKFDVAPDIAEGRIAVVNEMKDKRINVSDILDEDENKLIIGDNFEALKNLILTHKEKVDIIYIDPPYNTEKAGGEGNNSSSKEGSSKKFIYKDKFGRNGWLNMMRDRLTLAKKLLSNKGVIFISIDDSEQAYLKVLMDDIFGEENTETLIWRKVEEGASSGGTMKVTNTFRCDHEYIHIAYKNKKDFRTKKYSELPNFENEYKNLDNDPRGPFKAGSISMAGNENSSKYYSVTTPSGKKISRVWRVTESEMKDLISDNRIYFGKNGDSVPSLKIFINESRPVTPKSIFENLDSTFEANNYLESILGHRKFITTKPISLIKRILEVTSEKNSLILDFFAGSGTTAHAVLELNKNDEGNRKFILVTNNENQIGLNITYERLFRIINGIGTKGEESNWVRENVIFKKEKLRVFNIKHYNVDTSQIEKIEKIKDEAIGSLKKLSPSYKPVDLEPYYDLDGLNPYDEKQLKQEYSTDILESENELN